MGTLFLMRGRFAIQLAFFIALAGIISACSVVPTGERPIAVQTQLTDAALALKGTPYRFGGSNTKGFDCSGFVYYVHKQNGIVIPRSTNEQIAAAKPVPLNKIVAGDVLFFNLTPRRRKHVGLYLGDHTFIHAPSSGKAVMISDVNSDYWKKRLFGAGRFY